jgi:oxaloacetate decarboxylase beta subunit
MEEAVTFWASTGFYNLTIGHVAMICVGLFFIFLAIRKGFEPMLLVPIGFGILVGNIPFQLGNEIGIYEHGSVLNFLYWGVVKGVYPPLIFLGIGAMTDFSSLISRPKLMLLGASAQIGTFGTLITAVLVGSKFTWLGLMDPANPERLLKAAGSIAIIGGADGPTAIFLTSKLAPDLLGAITVSAYSYMALVPVIQPPIMRLLTTRKERLIRMKPAPAATPLQKILFPIVGLAVCSFIAPGALPLLGMLFFGNILKESGVTERLARTARGPMIDIVTILLGFTVGASTQADTFLRPQSLAIFAMGAFSFAIATASGLLFAKLMNLFSKEKINPLLGSAGVSAVPAAARVSHMVAQEEDPQNYLINDAMAPNVAGVIGSAVAAGVLLSMLT